MTLVYTVRRSQFSTPGTADTSPPSTFTSKLKSGMSTSAICRHAQQLVLNQLLRVFSALQPPSMRHAQMQAEVRHVRRSRQPRNNCLTEPS